MLTCVVQDYTFHAYGRTEGICGIIISDHQYPALVAHQLLSKCVDEFLAKHPRSSWASGQPQIVMPELKDYLAKYQDPQQADSIMKIQKELDETKIVLHKTIESVLQRGEKIDDLVAKSDGLSSQSKMFYRALSLHVPCLAVPCHRSRDILTPRFRASEEAKLVLCIDVVAVFGLALDVVSFPHRWGMLVLRLAILTAHYTYTHNRHHRSFCVRRSLFIMFTGKEGGYNGRGDGLVASLVHGGRSSPGNTI